MNINDLVGKTVKSAKELYSGDRIEILFDEGTLLRIDTVGFDAGLYVQINPEEELNKWNY